MGWFDRSLQSLVAHVRKRDAWGLRPHLLAIEQPGDSRRCPVAFRPVGAGRRHVAHMGALPKRRRLTGRRLYSAKALVQPDQIPCWYSRQLQGRGAHLPRQWSVLPERCFAVRVYTARGAANDLQFQAAAAAAAVDRAYTPGIDEGRRCTAERTIGHDVGWSRSNVVRHISCLDDARWRVHH